MATVDENIVTFDTDVAIAHQITHADDTTTVTTEGGPVKSFAKAVADLPTTQIIQQKETFDHVGNSTTKVSEVVVPISNPKVNEPHVVITHRCKDGGGNHFGINLQFKEFTLNGSSEHESATFLINGGDGYIPNNFTLTIYMMVSEN